MSNNNAITGGAAQLPFTRDEQALWDELDAITREHPEVAEDLGAGLLELQVEYRNARQTERPQAPGSWDR